MITQHQIDFFAENGYLRYGKVLEMDEVEALRAAPGQCDRHREGWRRRLGNRVSSSGTAAAAPWKATPGAQKPRVLTQYVNMWKREPIYERLLHHPVISGVASALLNSPRVRLWHDHIISKPPGDNAHFRFHQDFYQWPFHEPRLLSCWLAVDDATPENGCMHVVPGSHRDPRFGLESYAAELEARAAAEAEGREREESERKKMEYEPASDWVARRVEGRRVHVSP